MQKYEYKIIDKLEDFLLTALGEQNRKDFYDAHGREGTPQELKNYYFNYGGGKEQFGED